MSTPASNDTRKNPAGVKALNLWNGKAQRLRWKPADVAGLDTELPPFEPGELSGDYAPDPGEVIPGRRIIGTATVLLSIVGIGAFAVSFGAQFSYIFAEKGVRWAALTEAGLFDIGMVVLTLLGIGLSIAKKPSTSVRLGILLCAFGSAVMNYAAANDGNWKSILAYIFPPIFAAFVTDRVIATIRRVYLADEEKSAWDMAGKGIGWVFKVAGIFVLYSLRFCLDRRGTLTGVRQVVLNAAPLPAAPVQVLAAPDKPQSKKARLCELYKLDKGYGHRSDVGPAAKRLAPIVPMTEGTARVYLTELFDGDTLKVAK